MESPAKRPKIDEDLSKVDENGSSQKTSNGDTEKKKEKRPSDLNVISSDIGQNEVGERRVVKIEAEAAEDKGLRHTMEDAWMVLPHDEASSQGKLR